MDGSDEKDCGMIYVISEGKCRCKMTKQGNLDIIFALLSSSGLHHVPVDSMECMQCVLWAWLLVPTEGHIEGGSTWRGLWRSPI